MIVATVGGFLSQFEMNNVKILQEKGYEVHYAANLSNGMYRINFEELKKKNIVLHNLDIEKNPLKIQKHWEIYIQLKSMIEELQIDLVHCHTPVGGVLARLAAHFAKRKVYVIYTAHGFHFYKGAPLKNWVYYPVEKIMARMTDCLVTINQEDLKRASRFTYKKNGYAVQIPGIGIDTERFYPQPALKEKIRQELNLPEEAFHLITIGEINKNKNLEVVIRALSKLQNPNIYYSIYGRGKSVEYIENVIKECGLEKNVRCLGYCNVPERILQSADMFLFPSIREGLGMAALEALACGVPVTALDNRGTREYMKNGINGYVCYKNTPEEFAEKIGRAYQIYQNREFTKVFKETYVTDVKQFKTCETEKVMRNVYEYAEGRESITRDFGDYGSLQSEK